MAGILHISDAASLGLHAMAVLAGEPDQRVSTHEIASRLNVSEAHLAKVLQRLVKVELLQSVRGPKGGFQLARDPDEITLLQIYEAIDGPMKEGTCVLGLPICERVSCIFGTLLGHMQGRVDEYFSNTKLSKLVLEDGGRADDAPKHR
jgi:Rrf2 family protein